MPPQLQIYCLLFEQTVVTVVQNVGKTIDLYKYQQAYYKIVLPHFKQSES